MLQSRRSSTVIVGSGIVTPLRIENASWLGPDSTDKRRRRVQRVLGRRVGLLVVNGLADRLRGKLDDDPVVDRRRHERDESARLLDLEPIETEVQQQQVAVPLTVDDDPVALAGRMRRRRLVDHADGHAVQVPRHGCRGEGRHIGGCRGRGAAAQQRSPAQRELFGLIVRRRRLGLAWRGAPAGAGGGFHFRKTYPDPDRASSVVPTAFQASDPLALAQPGPMREHGAGGPGRRPDVATRPTHPPSSAPSGP